MNSNLIKIYSDGGARGNPGPAASAFVVIINRKVIYSENKYLGKATNNVAEYTAVLMAARWLEKNKKKYVNYKVNFFMDSELLMKQLKGEYKVRSENLIPLMKKIKLILSESHHSLNYAHVVRSKNTLADKLVNRSLDENI